MGLGQTMPLTPAPTPPPLMLRFTVDCPLKSPCPPRWLLIATLVAVLNSLQLPRDAQAQEKTSAPARTATVDSQAGVASNGCGEAEPQRNTASDPVPDQWVMKLGHQQYSIREHASEKLLRAGAIALPALERGSRHADREIRFRCERILSVVRENELTTRLDAFLNDHDPQRDYGFSGWKYVQAKLGNTPETRSLFVEMYQSEPEILAACDKGSKNVQEVLTDRVRALEQHLQQFPQDMPLGSAAAVLMMAGDDRVQYNMNAGRLVYSFSQFPAFRASVLAGSHRDLLRGMMGRWIKRDVDDSQAYQMLFVSMQYNFKDGLVPAERLVKRAANQPWIRHYAVMALAKLGDKGHAKLLEPLLNDQAVCSSWQNNNVTYNTQVRDSALVGILYLHKQDLRNFGFERAMADPANLFAPHTIGFENDEKRKVAFEKWNEFRKTLEDRPEGS